jgi:hypothetical protein
MQHCNRSETMGEYARAYTLERFGVDIGDDDEPPRPKREWKWSCKKCGKRLASEQANKDHMRDKHGVAAAPAVGAA